MYYSSIILICCMVVILLGNVNFSRDLATRSIHIFCSTRANVRITRVCNKKKVFNSLTNALKL